MMAVHIRNIVMPMIPVWIQIKTYSESGGTVAIKVYLLLAGTLLYPTTIPIPQGASAIYFFMASWLIVRTLADASSLLNALRIRRIC